MSVEVSGGIAMILIGVVLILVGWEMAITLLWGLGIVVFLAGIVLCFIDAEDSGISAGR